MGDEQDKPKITFDRNGNKRLPGDVVRRMRQAGLPKPADVNGMSWNQLQEFNEGRHMPIAYLAATGLKLSEIAQATGFSEGRLSTLLKSDSMVLEIRRIQFEIYGADPKRKIQQLVPQAIETTQAIMEDVQVKPAIRLQAASSILDRGLGRPQQNIEVNGSSIRQLLDRLDKIEGSKVIDAVVNDAPVCENTEVKEVTPQSDAPSFARDEVDEWVSKTFS